MVGFCSLFQRAVEGKGKKLAFLWVWCTLVLVFMFDIKEFIKLDFCKAYTA